MSLPILPDEEVKRIFNEIEVNGMSKKDFLKHFAPTKNKSHNSRLARFESLNLLLSEDDNGLLYKVKNDDNS